MENKYTITVTTHKNGEHWARTEIGEKKYGAVGNDDFSAIANLAKWILKRQKMEAKEKKAGAKTKNKNKKAGK